MGGIGMQELVIIAALIGIPLGILLGWYRVPRLVFDPFISGFYSTPRIVFVPLIIMWFGLGFASKMVIVFLSAFFPILLSAAALCLLMYLFISPSFEAGEPVRARPRAETSAPEPQGHIGEGQKDKSVQSP